MKSKKIEQVRNDYRGPRPPVSVVILTLNEEVNLDECLESCAWCDDVHLIDSGSEDRTIEIAGKYGANVHFHPFESFGKQRNWALDNVEYKYDWIFHLDADERFTPELVEEMHATLTQDPREAGFHVSQKLMFLGRWLKNAGGYPIYQMRLFHKQRARFRDYGHGQREETDGIVSRMEHSYLHFAFSKGIYDWLDKHNRYSTLEALQMIEKSGRKLGFMELASPDPIQRRRNWKDWANHLPFRPQARWFHTLWILGGVMEGRAGFTYAKLLAMYEQMIAMKLRLLKRHPPGAHAHFEKDTPHTAETKRFSASDHAIQAEAQVGAAAGKTIEPEEPAVVHATDESGQVLPEPSPWTFREKMVRAVWMLGGRPVFRLSPNSWWAFRRLLLRFFGARIDDGVRLHNTVHVEVPWNIDLRKNVTVAPHAILYSLGTITIGERTVVSQYAHLCAGTHDHTDRRFPLIRDPIAVGPDAWIAADSYVGPNVRVGRLAVLGARSSAYKDLAPQTVYAGNPAKAIKLRKLA